MRSPYNNGRKGYNYSSQNKVSFTNNPPFAGSVDVWVRI
jgi:hypothetical protein